MIFGVANSISFVLFIGSILLFVFAFAEWQAEQEGEYEDEED